MDRHGAARLVIRLDLAAGEGLAGVATVRLDGARVLALLAGGHPPVAADAAEGERGTFGVLAVLVSVAVLVHPAGADLGVVAGPEVEDAGPMASEQARR